MSRTVTYNPSRLPALKQRLEHAFAQFEELGYGSRMAAAKWLIAKKHQKGSLEQVAKKISHLLNGYVRGIHPTLRSGGVWRPEEAERILELLSRWLKSKAAAKFMPSGAKLKVASNTPTISPTTEDEF